MLTEFGKALRIIRIGAQELLKDMADKLKVSSAYLSAVETGKRRIPSDWVDKIVEAYDLSTEKADELRQAADNSACDVRIPLNGMSDVKKEAVLTFARTLDGLSDEDLMRIMSTMKGKANGRRDERRA
ncbi:helix-turn-helix transcriptional regulator [Bacteroides thetaiotaomicron]|jgi:cyanate lyase|nr:MULTISPECIES: helix-turn-helix transcriptional regulator [unclassified Pseudoflavonifractor]KAB4818066.1 helix-turn-helix transcriptional regulator [Bacteroides thetaiotaomicron]MTQ98837.1 helix-turn-helix domain-containing protein [Pseudoflavonifractor sp. BIOML-A16]MTR08092.1 helix-turn-helix domain-containing protein [Pseudoflavonifractor sp. BIOML-A15]MTR33956.1 helix-turn-helix domain-containing protein [Pseudoflavonifractor sp. BIOML-A14]MTR75069.1 helix-turn-helix domain-containing p